MSEPFKDTNPLAELSEVLEILNRSNIPIVVPENAESIDPPSDAEDPATSQQPSPLE